MTLGEAVTYYEACEPRGEYVLVVEGAPEATEAAAFWSELDIPAHVAYYVARGMTKKDAIKEAARDRGLPKNDVYQAVIQDQ